MNGTLVEIGLRFGIRAGSRPAAILHCIRLGASEAWAGKAALTARFLAFALIIGIWASLWRIVPPETLARVQLSYEQVVWYFTLTEIVVFSLGHAYWQVEDDLAPGKLTLSLVRPVGYVTLIVSEEIGRAVVKLAGFGIPGLGLAVALTGVIPFGPGQILPLVAMLVLGSAVLLVSQMLVGLTAAWVGSARAVFFIVQKFIFVLGGMIVPLTAYPALLQKIAWATPFPAMLFAPASLMLDSSAAHIVAMLELQLAWLTVSLLAIGLVSVAFERRLLTKGLV